MLFAETVDPNAFKDLAPPIQIALLLGALTFLTGAMVSLTAFTRIVIVLSFVRRALTTQEIPPNQVLIGLSIFMTFFIMGPTFDRIYQNAVKPLMEAQRVEEGDTKETIKARAAEFTLVDAVNEASSEMRFFMLQHTRKKDIDLFIQLSRTEEEQEYEDVAMRVLIPAFIISELKTAFIMGFCLYIPFLLVDLVISTILMSLGMMMMPPVVISTPCKLLLFVLVDGWHLIARALSNSFFVDTPSF